MTLLYRYLKAKSPPEGEAFKQEKKKFKFSSLFAKTLIGSGMLIIANVIWPIIYYELFTAPSLRPQEFLNPIPVTGADEQEIDTKSFEVTDLTKPTNWFPQAQYSNGRESKITHYTLSIPKFEIKDAVVEIGGEDLAKSLIHYPGTAFPGELGATIVFGHSVLPQFFNPNNYISIFTLIPTLELGDEIIVKFDGITYTYHVIDKVEVKPTNLSVLDQPYDNEYLRLITCTPPGTYLRRGVITAILAD